MKRLEEAGLIIVGRTNTPEFGFKNMTEAKLWGPVNNPYDLKRNAGGSTEAAAAASGMVQIAAASDGGGRYSVSFSGIRLEAESWSNSVGPGAMWLARRSVNFAMTKCARYPRELLRAFASRAEG